MAQLRETEYDPFTGETKQWYLEDNGDVTCVRSVDLSGLIDACAEQAMERTDFNNKKTRFHKVASIPPIVAHEILKNHHVDVFSEDPSDKKKVEYIIETEYPVLKTHSAKLWRPK